MRKIASLLLALASANETELVQRAPQKVAAAANPLASDEHAYRRAPSCMLANVLHVTDGIVKASEKPPHSTALKFTKRRQALCSGCCGMAHSTAGCRPSPICRNKQRRQI
jgi:hypothetical protein